MNKILYLFPILLMVIKMILVFKKKYLFFSMIYILVLKKYRLVQLIYELSNSGKDCFKIPSQAFTLSTFIKAIQFSDFEHPRQSFLPV